MKDFDSHKVCLAALATRLQEDAFEQYRPAKNFYLDDMPRDASVLSERIWLTASERDAIVAALFQVYSQGGLTSCSDQKAA